MIGQHALERLAGRVPATERGSILAACEAALAAASKAGIMDAAIRVHRSTAKHVTPDGSNGQVAVMLVRHGHAATIMWRRLSQPHTRAAYGTARVLCVKGTCEAGEHVSHR